MNLKKIWKNYKVSELADIIGGGTPKTSIAEYWNGNIPWLSVKDFNDDNRTVQRTAKRMGKELQKSRERGEEKTC